MTTIPSGRYMSVREYAKHNGVSIGAIYAAIRTKRLSAYNIDGIWIVPKNAIISNSRNTDGRMKGYSFLRKNDIEGFKKIRGIGKDENTAR